MIKNNKLLLLAIMIVPWVFVPMLGWHSFKRFLPSTLFMSFIVAGESLLANKRRWWRVYTKLHPKLLGELPLIAGPFFVGSLWIMKLTYGKIVQYHLLNLAVDSFFTFILVRGFQKIGFASLVRLKKYQLSLLFFLKSIVMYTMQYWFENRKKTVNEQRTIEPVHT